MKLRILLADDHEIVRRGLRALLEKHEGWEVCGEASDGREAIEKALQLNPDVVIVDIGMPNLNGLDTTRQLLQHDPHFKVIVLTITDSDQVIREALDAGARGFVLKSDAARVCRRGSSKQANVLHATSERPGAGGLSREGAHRFEKRGPQVANVNRPRA
jgi:DNA-binding NarL/FixJ family response regulator